jgi:hypothetical protein
LQSGRLKKLSEIRGQNNAKKGFDSPVNSPFEWQLAFCLQQNVLMGGGVQKVYEKINISDRIHGVCADLKIRFAGAYWKLHKYSSIFRNKHKVPPPTRALMTARARFTGVGMTIPKD